MPSARRMGSENAETRLKLIEAAALIVRKRGFAALTASILAKMVGLKRKIVHYYFASMSDLMIAVIRLEGDRFRRHFADALRGDDPFKETLALAVEASPVGYEVQSLALRNKAIAAELKRDTEALRKIETDALAQSLKLRGVTAKHSPVAMVFIMRAAISAMAIEEEFGVSEGHAETRDFIEEWHRSFMETGQFPDHRQRKSRSKKRKVKPRNFVSAKPRLANAQSR